MCLNKCVFARATKLFKYLKCLKCQSNEYVTYSIWMIEIFIYCIRYTLYSHTITPFFFSFFHSLFCFSCTHLF